MNKTKIISFLVTGALVLLGSSDITHASPLFYPGETLDPSCLPTDVDCTVSTIWTASSTNTYFNTGSVGIGTTSPSARLAVAGNVLASNFVAMSTDASTFTGMVGVGTSTPSANLDIYTSSTTSSTLLALQNPNYRATFGFSPHAYEALTLTVDAVNLNVLTLKNTNAGNAFSAMAFEGADGVEHGAIGVGNAGAGTFANSTYIETSYYPTSGTNAPWPLHFVQTGYLNGSNQTNVRMTIAPTGDVQFKNFGGTVGTVYDPSVNRLGINTTAQPQQPLDVLGSIVVGSSTANRSATLGGGYAIHVDSPSTDGKLLRLVRDSVVKADLQINGTGSSRRLDFIDTDNGSVVPLSLGLNGTGRLTTVNASTTNITVSSNAYLPSGVWGSTGNVGIGTTTPSNKLEVGGDAYFTGAIRAGGYVSSDGTTGFTGTCTLSSITSITVKNGLITGCN